MTNLTDGADIANGSQVGIEQTGADFFLPVQQRLGFVRVGWWCLEKLKCQVLRLLVGQDEQHPRGEQGHRREGDRAYPAIAGTKGAHGAPPCPDVDDGHHNRHGNEERCRVDAQNSTQD